MAQTTHDPSKSLPGWDYVPYYEDENAECDRLIRCLQQQIEDCFTTISRIQAVSADGQTSWRTLRDGLKCWRAAIRVFTAVK